MPTKRRSTRPRRSSKPTGSLAAFVDAKKNDTVLLGDIKRHVLARANADRSRRQDIIHPSEMAKADWCPRATAQRILDVRAGTWEPPSKDNTHLEFIFQEGHDVHEKYQTWLVEMGKMWGRWKCPHCGESVIGYRPLVDCCVPMVYAEVPIDLEDGYLISGHADGAMPEYRAMLEIKTMGLGTLRMDEPALVSQWTVKTDDGKSVVDYDGLFKSLSRPLASHIRQAGIYLHWARENGHEFGDRMVFVYENKANQQTREFVIPYPERIVADLLNLALDVKYAVDKGRASLAPCKGGNHTTSCDQCATKEEKIRDQDRAAERASADGSAVGQGEAHARPAADQRSRAPRGRFSESARRPHRVDGRAADAAVRADDPVDRVPERATRGGGGRRTVRRRRPVQGAGAGDAR